jgi:hypothetical protein
VVYVGWLVAGWWEYRQRRTPWIWFGLGWWWITILPFTGLIPINGILYEHWLYIPMIGFFTALCRSSQLLVQAIPAPKVTKKRLVLGGIALWTILAMILTVRQNFL